MEHYKLTERGTELNGELISGPIDFTNVPPSAEVAAILKERVNKIMREQRGEKRPLNELL